QVTPTSWSQRTSGPTNDPARLAAQTVLESPDPFIAYERALLTPFDMLAYRHRRVNRLDGGRDDVVVVIDGLDDEPGDGATAGLWDVSADGLAVRVRGRARLVTMRSPNCGQLRPATVLDLTAHCPAGVDDVREYLDNTCDLPARQRAEIAEAAQGCYVYAD